MNGIHSILSQEFKSQFERSIPFNEELFDRWERAEHLSFGKNSSIYDSSFVFGSPKVGKDVWIGPFTIIDGSGKLIIGDSVTISAGTHIYSHNNLKQTVLGNSYPIERGEVIIGNNTYIAPNVIISMDTEIGDHCIVAANSFVNKSFPSNSIIAGNPAKKIGEVNLINGDLELKYYK